MSKPGTTATAIAMVLVLGCAPTTATQTSGPSPQSTASPTAAPTTSVVAPVPTATPVPRKPTFAIDAPLTFANPGTDYAAGSPLYGFAVRGQGSEVEVRVTLTATKLGAADPNASFSVGNGLSGEDERRFHIARFSERSWTVQYQVGTKRPYGAGIRGTADAKLALVLRIAPDGGTVEISAAGAAAERHPLSPSLYEKGPDIGLHASPGPGSELRLERVAIFAGPQPEMPEFPAAPLRDLAKARGVTIGALPSFDLSKNDPLHWRVTAREFDHVPSHDFNWWAVHYIGANKYAFGRTDQWVAAASAHGLKLHAGVLVPNHNQTPEWLKQAGFGRDELIALMRQHIATIGGRYRGSIAEWTVVGEPLEHNGPRLRGRADANDPSVWGSVIGPDFIEIAFRAAREADPTARLMLAEYGIEQAGPKFDALYALVRDLKARGVPIDGVNFEGHYWLGMPGRTPSEIRSSELAANMRKLGELGLTVGISELDVHLGDGLASALQTQASVYRAAVTACLSVAACKSVTTWGVTDAAPFYIAGQILRTTRPTLLDAEYRPKPAYVAVSEALLAR